MTMEKEEKKENSHKSGHRKRMKERVLQHGTENLADYELLEMMLYLSIPRRDTKSIAKDLITKYSSFINLLQTPPALLEKKLSEKIIASLQLPRIAADSLRNEEEKPMPCLNEWKRLRNYIIAHPFFQEKIPKTYILYLDTKNYLLCLDDVSQKNLFLDSHNELAMRVLELHATALVIIHSHIEGSPLTLAQKTRALKIALAPLAVNIHDTVLIYNGILSSLEREGFFK